MADGFDFIDGGAVDEVGRSDEGPIDVPTSRRRLFKMGAVGVAAVGVAAVGSALTADRADAATGGSMIIGGLNSPTTETDFTEVYGGPLAVFSSSHNAVAAAIEGSNAAGPGIIGVAGGSHVGVQGTARTGTPGAVGVNGTGVIGVQGTTTGGGSVAIGPGVLGVGNGTGVGIQAENTLGASLRIVPYGTTTLPGISVPGQFIVLSDGSLHYSYADDAWRPVNSTVQIDPVRVIDTVNGTGGITGPLVPGTTVHTSSAIAGTQGIPAAATGIVGNFAISGVGGALLNGYGVATIYPAGASLPATATVNAGAGCFATSNAVSVGFGTGGSLGKVSIVWGGGGPVPHAQAFVDVTGYIL